MRPLMHLRRFLLRAFAPAALLLLAGCMLNKEDHSPAVQGGGSETTVTGRVVDANGAPVPGAAIRIRPENDTPPNLYSADSSEAVDQPVAYSGPDGGFRLPGLASGSYFVECRAAANQAALLQAEISGHDSLHLPDAVLRPTGAIKGRIIEPMDGSNRGFSAVYVYIPGLWKRQVVMDQSGFGFLLKDIPAGKYTLRLQPAFPSMLAQWNILELRDVEVTPGDTLDLDSLSLPERKGIQDSMYTQDSAMAWAYHLASLAPGEEPESGWVERHTGVIGNRIKMLYELALPSHGVPKEIQTLSGLESIIIYSLTDSSVRSIAPEISTLPHLNRLSLMNCDLKNLPAWTGSFPALTVLDLSEVDRFPEWVLELGSLRRLSLGQNLTSLPKEIGRLKNLVVLNLAGNQLQALPPELLRMKSLQGVSLRGNRLCETTAEEKAWIERQDSLVIKEADPLSSIPDTLGWEATQRCGP